MKVERIEGFSAHAGKDDLERWLSNFKSPPAHIFLTHGEEEAISSLEDYLRSKNGWKVSAPEYLQEYDF
jgi:metallo-beta-lactamase family protein